MFENDPFAYAWICKSPKSKLPSRKPRAADPMTNIEKLFNGFPWSSLLSPKVFSLTWAAMLIEHAISGRVRTSQPNSLALDMNSRSSASNGYKQKRSSALFSAIKRRRHAHWIQSLKMWRVSCSPTLIQDAERPAQPSRMVEKRFHPRFHIVGKYIEHGMNRKGTPVDFNKIKSKFLLSHWTERSFVMRKLNLGYFIQNFHRIVLFIQF